MLSWLGKLDPAKADELAVVNKFLEKPELVRAWEALPINLRKNTDWLSRASRWLDEGIEVVADGDVARLNHSGAEIGRIKNETLLATNYTHGFEGDAVGEVVNGCQVFNNGNQIYVKRVPDVSAFTSNERAILKAEPDAHCLEKHGSDVTDEALKLRASEGIAPNGEHVGRSGPPYPTQDGSKFNSAEDISRALSEVGPSTSRYQTAFEAAVINGDKSFAVEFAFSDSAASLGYGYRKNTLEQVPEIRKVLAAYKRNDLTGEYYLVTMYPKIN
ncbi:MAG: hypothetical protein R2828_03310 [Saprospiraceae bacterium]